MTTTIRLLGRPAIQRDGAPAGQAGALRENGAPRGYKAWALLAYLLLTGRPPSRAHLVSLLFTDAVDPLGALRWNVCELRRALRGVATLDGDPLALRLLGNCAVDVRELSDGTPARALALDGFGQELLEGVSVPSAPGFEAWLAAERARVAACSETVLVERALDLLAAGSAAAAAGLAARAVAVNPLHADHHTVLVRALRAAGDEAGARRHAVRCTDLFRRELGCSPPGEVLAAATTPAVVRRGPAASAAAVQSYLDAGHASLTTGAVARGLEQLNSAAAMAATLGDPLLRATAFVALAGARVHSAGERGTAVRGLLQEVVTVARAARAGDLLAAACRELGFLALQRGQQDRALAWLDEGDWAATDDGERARLAGVRGMCLTDAAHYRAALTSLAVSTRLAAAAGDQRQEAWSRSMIGRVHTLRGDHELAAAVLDGASQQVARLGWTAFQPWPEAFRAEAAIGLGELGVARGLLEHAWVLATENDDHCWIAVVARAQAALEVAEGRPARGMAWCESGLRPAPWYLWAHARLLELACSLAPSPATGAGRTRLDQLLDVAGRGSMRDLLVRAHLHHARAGSRTALAAARAIAAGVEDPALHARVVTVAELFRPDSRRGSSV